MEGEKAIFKSVPAYIVENKSLTIIKEIREVMFPHLVYLNFHMNIIESVEGLNRVHLPALKQLWISTNASI